MKKYLVEGLESTSDLLVVIDSFNITKQKGKVNSFFYMDKLKKKTLTVVVL